MIERSKLLNAIIENAIDGIITIDENGLIEHINPAALNLFGYAADEIVGKNISCLMPQPYRDQHDGYIAKYKSTNERHIIGIGREVTGLRKDGRIFPFRLGVSEVKFSDRRIFTGFIHDLTKEKEHEHQIKTQAENLELQLKERTKDLVKIISELETAKDNMSQLFEKERELNQLKTRFVSMASHEFRTPLGGIQLSASLINKYAERSDLINIEKHTQKIKNSVDNLTTILNDFLSLERLEAGKVHLNTVEFNIVKFADEIVEEMQLISKKDQHIVYEHTGNDARVFLDPNLLKNCVFNLISNAIKYSGPNTLIEFSTKVFDNQLEIIVKDNGIGIPEEEQKNLFEPFFRAHNTGDIQGTGLGLNIARRYAALMNGHISCISKLNEGTTFTLNFTF